MPNSLSINLPRDSTRTSENQTFLNSLQKVAAAGTSYGNTAGAPTTGLYVGQTYFNTDVNDTVTWNGSGWANQTSIVYDRANAAANTVAVYYHGNLILADATLNFSNTATINVSVTANGTTQTNIAFTANVPLQSNGTFSAGLIGLNPPGVVNCSWVKIGSLVTMRLSANTGTSNANTLGLNNIPSAILPTVSQQVFVPVVNNGVANLGVLLIQTGSSGPSTTL